MEWQYNDGGRVDSGFKGSPGDCVVRSVAIASELPYKEVYDALSHGCKTQRLTKKSTKMASARDGVNVQRKWFKDYMKSIGFKWIPTMHIGSGCKVHLTESELPLGRLVVSVSKHYTAVINGVIQDTHDPSDRPTTVYSLGTHKDELPKLAYLLENGNGWAYSPQRCVYGYWIKEKANGT